jgi:hypothetical protein
MVIGFILMQLDAKPVRLKGVPVITGIAVGCGTSPVRVGGYLALRSRKSVAILSAGGNVLPDPRFDAVYRHCAPVPLALGLDVGGIPDVMGEIFVHAEESILMEEGGFDRRIIRDDLCNFWLPCRFDASDGEAVGYGWVLQDETMLRYRLLSGSQASATPFTSISITNGPDLRIVID